MQIAVWKFRVMSLREKIACSTKKVNILKDLVTSVGFSWTKPKNVYILGLF